MDFAADAVVDVMAPPPRAGGAKAASADASSPSFDDHLEAAAADEAPEDTPAPEQKTETSDSKESAETISPAPAPTSQPEPTAAPVLVQMIVAAAPQAQAPAANAAATAAPAPIDAPMRDAPPTGESVEAAGDKIAEAGASSPPSVGPAKSDTSQENKVAPPTQAPAAPNVQPLANDAATVAPINAAPTPAPTATAPTAEQAAQTASAAAAPPPSNAPREASRAPKSEARGEFKVDAPVHEGNAPTPQPAANKSNSARIAPVAANTKDGAPVAPQPAPSIDAAAPQALAPATTAAQAMGHAQPASLEQGAARAAPAAAQVAREIVRRFDGETTRFELRLDPPELGRVEVRLEVSRDHRVTAVISADSPQALTELARHARELEQTLQSAGLELSDNGLSFDLRQGRDDAADANEGGSSSSASKGGEDAPQEPAVAARPIGMERWRGVRVDVTV